MCLFLHHAHRFGTNSHRHLGLALPTITFAKNDISFIDPTGVDHDALGIALNKALYNYMHGIGLEQDVRSWFDGRAPKTTVPSQYIAKALTSNA